MVTQKDLLEKREQIQQDLLCFLDGMDNEVLDKVCDVIVEHFQTLLSKCEL
jgi:hypothetical protein